MEAGLNSTLPRSPVRLSVASAEDLPAVLNTVRSEYGEPYSTEAFWRWRYFSNPVAQVEVYAAWASDGRVAALQPVSGYAMTSGGERTTAYLLTAAITHPDFRRQGLFRRLVEEITVGKLAREAGFFFTFPNHLSVQGFRRFAGWQEREQLSLYIRPVFAGLMATGKLPDNSPSCTADNEVQLVRINRFERDTGPLLQTAFGMRSTYVGRNCEFLNWRYCENPVAHYWKVEAERNGELVGYTVAREMMILGLSAALVVDLVAADNRAALALLRRVTREAQRRRLRMIGYLNGQFSPYRAALLRAGFVPLPRRLNPRRFYLYTYPRRQEAGEQRPATDMNWYVTWGDTDIV